MFNKGLSCNVTFHIEFCTFVERKFNWKRLSGSLYIYLILIYFILTIIQLLFCGKLKTPSIKRTVVKLALCFCVVMRRDF